LEGGRVLPAPWREFEQRLYLDYPRSRRLSLYPQILSQSRRRAVQAPGSGIGVRA
jgi:hypothetical protein